MITTYHRPQTMDEALALLKQPNTLPSAEELFFPTRRLILFRSGSSISRLGFALAKGNDLEIGATDSAIPA